MRSTSVALIALVAAVSVLAGSSVGEARCLGSHGRRFALLGPTHAVPGGAFLVTVGPGRSAADSELPNALTLRPSDCQGTRCAVRATLHELAWNLYRVDVPRSLAPGEYRVDDVGNDARVSIAPVAAQPAITATPRVRGIVASRGRDGERSAVQLELAAPSDAVGVVIRWNGTSHFAASSRAAPTTFGITTRRCWVDAPRLALLQPGDRIEVGFVDASGRLSPPGRFEVPPLITP